ncbi:MULTISPECIES: aspartate carbamoyltransferase [unclassified Colwellia]|uniref:aspartate carbamoyltransferase n=1 Tax=unclassified Colwellia TaxID=196834 RepID=UPI0015F6D959|nr:MULTISPECIES: aspartate carbamoyltransferase [unclassified Colwellia]MBA6232130.1 aspartate carbamoyltransferase [Colwellia sp. MB02u-7]MBA6237172.1 aspartate carbamoyltransferase [Colwellia sp. MB02u-11]MBA6257396.1 aspartate carbamoyltransferase [Colwellia sp. MB3u-28]MBA6260468.1 aspartate carbamoyltransferase [Colwellia sp. MB3u-41]MBA6301564.1 aspartate carbamoyltransferase [Colwellia sp. MB3u-22]
MKFEGSHILSVSQFNRDAISRILEVSSLMAPYAMRKRRCHVLEGAILNNLFFEPSTRTRVSFGAAFNLLGGSVRETVGQENSSLSKGESLFDTARVISGYSDVIAMRHPTMHSVEEFSKGSSVPVINGGDGANEHPTQALLDLFTIQSEMAPHNKTLDGLNIVLMGDLKHGRTVHSLSKLLSLYKNMKVTMISPDALKMPDSIISSLTNAGHDVVITDKIEHNLSCDIIYQTRIQQERFASKDEANLYRGHFSLNKEVYQQFCQEHTVIMHPLPRDSRPEANELDSDLNDLDNLAIFRQAQNGVLVRMALFALTLGVENKLSQFEKPVTWYTNK